MRAHTAEARGLVEANMRRIIDATAEVMGCTAELEYTYIEPPIRNDDIALNDIARDAARSLYGCLLYTSTCYSHRPRRFSWPQV